ncbi:MAG: hypothetical protein K0Q72_4308, partial [Armatimonadetes bacterium]|nr:hypothetical protein [Armatimonadota bacterium]
LGARLGDSRPELAPLLARYLASRGSEPTPFWNAAAVAMARSPEFAGRFLQGLSGSSAGREDAVRRLVGGSPTRARVLSFALGRALAAPTQGDPHRADLLGRLIGRRKDLAQAALAGVVGSAHRGSMASTRSDLLWRISIQGLARASERSFAFRELLDEQLLQLAHDPRSMERWARQDPDSVAQSIDRLPSLMLPIIGTEEGRRAARSSPKIVASLLRAAQRIQDSRLARELASPSQSPLQLCLAHAAGATEDLAGGTVSRAVRRFIERPSLHRDLAQEERKGRREATGHWSEEEPREAPARAGARSPAARPRAQRAALPPGLGPGHPGIPPRPASRESARSRRNAPGDTRSNPLLGSRRTDPPLTNDLPVLKRNQQLTAPLGGARQRAAQSRPLAAGRAHSLAARALPGAVPRAPKTTGASLRPTPGITAPRRLARPGGVSGARQPDRMSPGQPLIPRPVQLPGRSTAGGPMAATAQSGGPGGASRSERGSKVQLSTPQLPARPDAQRAVALRDQLVQSNGPGQAIPPAQRAEMEQYFGHRMDNVRLHTGAHVSRAADSLQADAFTIGRDVFFAPGKLAVDTKEGKALLAHELTHVVQQTGMGRRFHGYGNAPQTLEEEARHVERIFRKAPTTGGGALAISRVNLTLENAGAAPVTRDHRERLEAITALALELAQQRLSVDARTPTGRFHLSALDVALEIDLELSDEDSARRLADAICLRLWKHAPEPRPSRAAAPVLPQVQRFESDEHRDIGAKGSGAKRLQLDLGDGTQLTYGEMVALAGDFFESLSEIQTLSRSRAGKEQLRWARWKALYQGSPPPEVSNDARQAVETRYRTLAARNASHFSQGGQAQSNYQSYHQSALRLAFEAGASAGRHEQEGQWEAALLNEAFGNHFLTDMFSSGHVRTPREEISRWYAAQFADSNERLLAHMADAITNNLITIDQPRWTPRWAIRSKVRSQLDATVGRSFSLGDLVALAWHNADNQGLQVVSEAGPDGVERKGGFRWEAVGDEHLHQPGKAAGTTQQMVVAAVKASLQELEHARAAGRRARGAKGDVAKARQQFLATHSRSAAERLVPHTDERTPNAEMAWKWGHFNEAMH